jgi:hypothetical protein
MLALDTLDFWVGTMAIVVLALVQSILYGWVFGIERGDKEAHHGAHLRIPWFVQLILKYVTPLFLIAIFVGVCVTQGPSYLQALRQPVALMAVGFAGLVWLFLLIVIHIAGRRWEAEGRFKYLEP